MMESSGGQLYSRRQFFKLAGILTLTPLARGSSALEENITVFDEHEIRVVQGVTTSTETIITVVAHRNNFLNFDAVDSKNCSIPISIQTVDMKLNDFVVHQVLILNIKLSEQYKLKIESKFPSKSVEKKFKALDLGDRSKKIALLSCSNHREAKSKDRMYLNLFSSQPDVIFHIGDLVYANSSLDTFLGRPAQPADAYSVYIKTLMEFPIYSKEHLIPIFSTWDDHDLAFNNSESNHPYRDIMYQIFRSFFPLLPQSAELSHGPGVSFCLNAFGMQVFFLDTRFNKNSKAKVFLGADQINWVKENLLNNDLPKFFMGSQQFFNYRFFAESFQRQAPEEFNNFLLMLRQLKAPVLFASGDVHYSQIQRISNSVLGYTSYEITSSCFFSSSAGSLGKRSYKDGQLNYFGKANFLTLQPVESKSDELHLDVYCISEDSDREFYNRLKLTLSDNGKN